MMDWNSSKKRFWILSHFDAGIKGLGYGILDNYAFFCSLILEK